MDGPRGWDIEVVFDDVDNKEAELGVHANTSERALEGHSTEAKRVVRALQEIARFKESRQRRSEENEHTREEALQATSKEMVASLWALATVCLEGKVDEKQMAVEAAKERSR